jgi:hypothetical protein
MFGVQTVGRERYFVGEGGGGREGGGGMEERGTEEWGEEDG